MKAKLTAASGMTEIKHKKNMVQHVASRENITSCSNTTTAATKGRYITKYTSIGNNTLNYKQLTRQIIEQLE